MRVRQEVELCRGEARCWGLREGVDPDGGEFVDVAVCRVSLASETRRNWNLL